MDYSGTLESPVDLDIKSGEILIRVSEDYSDDVVLRRRDMVENLESLFSGIFLYTTTTLYTPKWMGHNLDGEPVALFHVFTHNPTDRSNILAELRNAGWEDVDN